MARKNMKMKKLRQYRDKLIANNVNLRGELRLYDEYFREIRLALTKEDYLRAYTVAVRKEADEDVTLPLDFVDKNELAKELTLVYKMLAVERNYTENVGHAAANRDLLRIAALVADHKSEQLAHDKMLSTWSQDHGFTRSLRDEVLDTDTQ